MHPNLPTPKYQIGQRVFRATETSAVEALPCPDCLGTKKWKVTTPGGTELEAPCLRCGQGHSLRNVPSLEYRVCRALVTPLTIGSIQIDTNAGARGWGCDDLVKYMCTETGVGSGSVYNERDLYETEAEAESAAAAGVSLKNSEAKAKPERIAQADLSYLPLKDAVIKVANDAIWESWYRYRSLRENIEEIAKEDGGTLSDLRDALQSELDFDRKYRGDNHVFDRLIKAAVNAAQLYGDDKLLEAVRALPLYRARKAEIDEALADAAHGD